MKRWQRRIVRPLGPVPIVSLFLLGIVAPWLLIERVGGTLAVVAGVSCFFSFCAVLWVGAYIRWKTLINGLLQGMSHKELEEMFSRPKKRSTGHKP